MNGFVDYLNSTNNASGNSTGSLAESQVKSEYFDKVKVDRKLGRHIANSIKQNDYHAYILTGHAGDGKTSILVQVLKELKLIKDGESLSEIKEYEKFFYVKDMSEISEDQQIKVLEQALSAPDRKKGSLLISNTGPLIETFIRLSEYAREIKGIKFAEEDRIALQSKLLVQLDTNSDKEIEIEGYKFYLVNIARVDNVLFSKYIFKKILSKELWEECESCTCGDRCPIKNNIKRVTVQEERVSRFIESYYRFLYENDRRMTIRQMVGQMSYAITGNLSCDYIKANFIKEPFFNYNFANLFFGYIGLNDNKDSSQIKGVSQLKLLGLDRVSLDVDYRLFVNNDYSAFFNEEISGELYELKKMYQKHYQVLDEDSVKNSSEKGLEAKLRRAIRRYYLIFSSDNNEDSIFNQIYGKNFTLYNNLISLMQPKAVLRNVQTLVFKAMYIKNTGFLPDKQTELPLTLRRENNVFQNVMLVLGNVPKSELVIIQQPMQSLFEDNDTKQELLLKIKDKSFMLTLPILTYFENLIQGAISSNINPAVTHGVAKLDTLLLDEFEDDIPDNMDDCELKILVNTTKGQEIRYFAFNGNGLSILT